MGAGWETDWKEAGSEDHRLLHLQQTDVIFIQSRQEQGVLDDLLHAPDLSRLLIVHVCEASHEDEPSWTVQFIGAVSGSDRPGLTK